MTICIAVNFVVEAKDHDKARELLTELKQHFESEEKYSAVRSMRFYTHIYGGTYGTFVDLEEYDSFAACEETQKVMENDSVVMRIYQELVSIIDPATYSINAWQAVA
jgi:hypothetical protein